MKKYFRLFEECYILAKERNPAIYNTFTGVVYVIKEQEAKLLSYTENNIDILKAAECAGMGFEEAENILEKYKENKLGNYYDSPVYICKVAPDYTFYDHTFFKIPPVINKAIISLSNQCSKKCKYCNSCDYINILQCNTCNGREKQFVQDYMEFDRFTLAITKLRKYNCSVIVFKIPDMSQNMQYYKKILAKTKDIGIDNIQVICGSGYDEKNIEYLLEHDITPILQVNIEKQSDICDLAEVLEKRHSHNLSRIFLTLVIDFKLTNEESIESAIDHISKMTKIQIDYMLNKKEDVQDYIASDYNYISQLPLVDVRQYAYKKSFNSCLNGSVYIDQCGNIYPCPGLIDFKVGNIDRFSEIFDKKNIQSFWRLSGGNIEKCKKCGLQSLCSRCMGFEYQLSGNFDTVASCNK